MQLSTQDPDDITASFSGGTKFMGYLLTRRTDISVLQFSLPCLIVYLGHETIRKEAVVNPSLLQKADVKKIFQKNRGKVPRDLEESYNLVTFCICEIHLTHDHARKDRALLSSLNLIS